MIDTLKINPCPFCFSNKDLQSGYIYPNYIIKCYKCGIVMSQDRKDKLVSIWNNRS